MTKINEYCKDVEEWPNSWEIETEDVEIGRNILFSVFIPFFESLIEQGLTRKTIRKHVNNIWMLGGEIIEEFQWNEGLRKLKATDLVLEQIDEEAGPHSKHICSNSERKSFDSTCKKLYKYLTNRNLMCSKILIPMPQNH